MIRYEWNADKNRDKRSNTGRYLILYLIHGAEDFE